MTESDMSADGERTELFRTEVYDSQVERLQGTILLARPMSGWAYVALAMFAALLTIGFAVFGSYTRRETVDGEVSSNKNVAKVYGTIAGTVVKRLVTEGQRVEVGQPLYVISTETNRTSGDGAQSAIAMQLAVRIEAMQAEKQRQQTILNATLDALRVKVQNLTDALAADESRTAIQMSRVKVDEENLARLKGLTDIGFYPPTQLADRKAEVLDQRARLAEDEEKVVDARNELRTAQTDLSNAPLMEKNAISALERQISELREQDISNDIRREVSVTALVAGTATTPLVDAGDAVSPATLLVSVLPAGARMDAHLYVPSKAIGFVRVGTPVSIRYDAFPYQKFGQYGGHVSEISRVALSPNELREMNPSHEPLYRITMRLDDATVLANGVHIPIQDGMKMQADLLLETRPIYEWMMEPLYSLTKRYSTP